PRRRPRPRRSRHGRDAAHAGPRSRRRPHCRRPCRSGAAIMSLSADDAADRVSQITALTERLTERLTVEAAAFEARRPQDAAKGMTETQDLANVYRRESAKVKADPSLIEAAPAAARAALLKATEAFEAILT